MDYRRVGSFRQRARNTERVSRQLREYRRQRVASRTHEAIQAFEDHLRTVQEAALDDLPIDAEAGHYHYGGHGRGRLDKVAREAHSDTSSPRNRAVLLRTQSETLHPASRTAGPDVDLRHDQRPPSPLAMYDYGAISVRPRSVLAQRSKEIGESARPGHRQSGRGFYFPGAEMRQGPYGFSMLDPILMPPRCWVEPTEPPTRWSNDAGDIRPATTEALDWRHRRSRSGGPTLSPSVRSSKAHDRRAALAFSALDKRNEEAQLERARFEAGVFEGRWRDPLVEGGAAAAAALAPAAPTRCGFLTQALDEVTSVQKVAAHILFGLEGAMRALRSNLASVFRAVNRGTPGVLEPHEFLEGLVRLGVVQEGQLTVDNVIKAVAHVDPNFDGRVNFTALERAVAAARRVESERAHTAERLAQHREQALTNSYGETLPIDVVKIERQPRSIFDFEKSFERFRKQQKELLVHHGENMH